MKKLMSFLLALAMVLTVMAGITVTAGAEETYTYISDVYYSADGRPKTLAAGQPLPEIALRSVFPSQYTMSYVWLDGEENELPAGTVTEFGETYCLRLKAFAQEGYAFAKNAWFTGVNDYYTVGTLGDGAAEFWGDKYYTAWNDLGKVEVTIAEPKAGEPLAKPVVVSGEATADSSFWVEYGESEERLDFGTLARAGYRYTLFLNLSPKEEYTFTQDTQLLLNGEVRDFDDASHVTVYKGYDLSIVLDAFDFDLADAQVGQPFPQAVVAEDAGYTATTVWRDMYTDAAVAEDAVVAEGGIYQVSITLQMDALHKVAEEITLTVNGQEPEGYYYGSAHSNTVTYRQVVSFAQPLEKVEVTFTEPAAGVARGEFSVPEGANYYISERTRWENDDDSSDPVETFAYGNRYELNLYVSPEFGYAITEDTKMYVNGEKLPSGKTSGYWTYLYHYREYSLKTVIDKVELPAIPELKVGDTLPTGGAEGENFTYEFVVEAVDTEGNALTGTTVVEGGTYVVGIVATPKEGCEFAQDAVVTVGGKAPSAMCYIEADRIQELRVYSFGGHEIINEISIRAAIPYIGQSKGGEITVDGDAGYELGTAIWGVSPDGSYENADELTEPLQAGENVLLVVEASAKEGYVFSSELKITVNGQVYAPTVIMGDAGNVGAIIDLGEAGDPPDYNGLVPVDGVWGYYEGGVLQTDYTGLVPYGDILFYVENGILDFTYTGLVWYDDAWRYVANSQLTEGYTGLVWFNDNWFYTVDSVIDWTFTGLVPYEGNYFYVQNNLLDWSYTGLGYHDGGWYFIQNGLLQKEYSGLVYFNDNWFYVEEGVLTYQYFGMVEYEGNLFYVQASHLDWSYTGLGYHEGAWYYFQNALYTPSFSGLVAFNGSLFYVNSGTVDWSYNGEAEYNGTTYTVINGVVEL